MITETLSQSPRVAPAFALAVSIKSDADRNAPEIRTSIFELLKDSRARFSLVLQRLCLDLGCEHAELWLTHDDLRLGVECSGPIVCDCCHGAGPSRLADNELRQFLVYLHRSGGEVCLIEDVKQAATVWPELEALGVRGAIAFAVTRESEPVGVVVLVSSRPLDLDGIPAAVLTALGAKIGYVLDRRSSERVLRESAETFQALFEDAPVAYCELDAKGTVARVNTAYCELLGWPARKLIGQRVWNTVGPEDRDLVRDLTLRFLQGEQSQPSPVERTFRHASGADRHTVVHANLLRSPDGTVRGARAAFVDVTEQWRVEKQRKAVSAINAMSAEIANTFLEDGPLSGALVKCADSLVWGFSAVAARVWQREGDGLSLLASAGPSLPRSARLESVSGWLDAPQQTPPEAWETEMIQAGVGAVLIFRVSSGAQPRVLAEVFLRSPLDGGLLESIPGLARAVSLGVAHKLSEAALAASERKHRQIVETAGEGVWIGSRDCITTFVNSRMAEMLACEGDTALDRPITDFVVPDDRQDLLAAFRRVLAGERASFEMRLSSRDGASAVWVQVSASPLPQPDGSTGVLAMMTNITSQKKAYEALSESEKKYRRILEHMSEGMMIFDTDQRVVYANEQLAEMLGYSKTEIEGADAIAFLPPEDREVAFQRLAIRAAGNSPARERRESRMLRRDGAVIWCRMSVGSIRDDSGAYQGSFVMSTDITATRKAEEALRAAEERFRIAAENASDVIMEGDLRTGLLQGFGRFVPPGVLSTLDEALAVIHPDDRESVVPRLRAAWESPVPADIEFRTLNNGNLRHWSTRSVVLRDEAGVPSRLIGVATDVTRQRLAEEQLASSLHLLQRVTDTVPAMIYVLDEQLNCTFTNNAWGAFAAPDGGWLDSMHPDDRPGLLAAKREMGATHREVRNEYRLMSRNGEYRWFMDRALPYQHPDGSFGGYIGCAIDITDIRSQQRELRTIWHAVEQSRLSVLIMDASGLVEYVNPAFTAITGYEPAEVLGRTWRLFEAGSPLEPVLQQMRASGENHWSGELISRRKNGEQYWESLAIAPVKDAGGVITNLIALKEDITARKKIEQDLRTAEELNRCIFDSTRDGIVVMNRSGEFLCASRSAQEIGGSTTGFELPFPQWLCRWEGGAGDVAAAFSTAFEGGEATFRACYRAGQDSRPRWFDVSLGPIAEPQGEGGRVLAVFRDITEREAIEQLR